MIHQNTKLWKYMLHLFISVDQLGNVVVGGNPDNTISARVGYYNYHYYKTQNKVTPWYWVLLRKIIDITFLPVDGPNHCHQAYHNDPGEFFDNRVTNFFIAVASISIIIPICVVIALVLYTLAGLQLIKRKTIQRDKNIEKRIQSCNFILKSVLQEMNEHPVNYDTTEVKKRMEILLEKADEIKIVINY